MGIFHNRFTSETQIVSNKEVEKVIHDLKKKNLIYEGTETFFSLADDLIKEKFEEEDDD